MIVDVFLQLMHVRERTEDNWTLTCNNLKIMSNIMLHFILNIYVDLFTNCHELKLTQPDISIAASDQE